MAKDRRNAQAAGGAAPPSSATVLKPVVESGGIKSPADLNRRNRDSYHPVPLPARDRDGKLVDPRFPHLRDDPMFPKKGTRT